VLTAGPADDVAALIRRALQYLTTPTGAR
jgi:hypothetical protein